MIVEISYATTVCDTEQDFPLGPSLSWLVVFNSMTAKLKIKNSVLIIIFGNTFYESHIIMHTVQCTLS